MQCVVPTCDENDFNSSQEIAYFKFPSEPSLRAEWLESLHKVEWQPEEDSRVCSKHFQPDDLLEDSNGQQILREGAVPVTIVPVCRVCFATDCKLYLLTSYKTLQTAYELFTGLAILMDNKIPPYLCNECSHQLLKCSRFRMKSLEAHAILMDIYMKHNCITLESIRSVNGIKNPTASNEPQILSELHNIDMEITEMENTNTNEQICQNITVDCVKMESEDEVNQEVVADKNLGEDVMVYLIVENIDDDAAVDSCKAENDDEQCKDSPVAEISNDMPVDTMEGHPVDENPPLADTQDIQLNITDPEEETLLEEVPLPEEVTLPEDDTQTQDETQEKPGLEDVPTITGGATNEALELEEGSQSSEQMSTEEQEAREVMKILENFNHAAVDTPKTPEVEGENSSENSLPLGEISQADMNATEIHELTLSIEKMDDTNGSEKGLSGKEMKDKLSCEKCPFQTRSKTQMLCHIKAHAASKSYNCSMCSYKTIYKRSLTWHKRVHTGEKPYSCDHCDKKFSQQCSLRAHMRHHTGKRPYKCKVCSSTFTDLTTLRRHVIIHTGEKPFTCDICNKTFRQTGHLKGHMRMHAGEKPFTCDYCKKGFSQKPHLIKHIRIHTDGLQYACRICHMIFRRDVTLKRHMRKHSNNKFSCEVCKKVFSQKSSLRVHFKKHTAL